MARIICLALTVFMMLCASVQADGPDYIGGNEPFARRAQKLDLQPQRPTRPSSRVLAPRAKALLAQVMGYYPYWSSTEPADLDYELLSTVAWFGASIGDDGFFTDMYGWPDGDLIDEAHANGTRVVLTVTNFSETSITNLLSVQQHRSDAVAEIVDEVTLAGADGANIDFEGLAFSQKNNFVTFITALRAALNAALPGAHLSIATPAVDWNGSFDFDALAAQTDYLFIMAYDYHWRNGDPGPVSPLRGGATWGDYGIEWTLDDYEFYITPYDLSSVILGLPLYGYNWPTTNDSVPGTTRGSATAVILSTSQNMADNPSYGGRQYDTQADSPSLVWYENGDGWRQLWYEDAQSLALRFDYAKTRGTGGVGFWALGYAGSNSGLWEAVEDAFYESDDDVNDDINDDADDDANDDIDDDVNDDMNDDANDDANDDSDDDWFGNDDDVNDDTGSPADGDAGDDDDNDDASCCG